MDLTQKIKEYLSKQKDQKEKSSIFLDLADDIIKKFSYRLKKKTYLLIPEPSKEMREMSYEYRLSKGKEMPISLTLRVHQIIDKFIELTQELGFEVITKMSEYANDGELFDLLGLESSVKGLIEEETNDLPGIKAPMTLSVDAFADHPFFPVVFKNITANRGEDKYLIETNEQLDKIMALFELPESKKLNLKSEFVVQEFIKGFKGINTSIRVLTTCTGEVISSLFLVSADSTPKKRVKKYGIDIFNPCEYLSDPSSSYYLNARNIISNSSGGGRVLPLNPNIADLRVEDRFLLTLHGIDLETYHLPETISNQCKVMTEALGTKKGIVLGIDFIYNSIDNEWYYLETNRNPSVEGYMKFMNLKGYLKKDVKTLIHLDSLIKIVEHQINKDKIAEKPISKRN